MKRFLSAFLLLLLFSFIFPNPRNFAQNSSEISPTPTPKVAEDVSYELPYPGILPDNPLYFVKVLRDNVLGVFITDPLKKSEYYLLMADKRLVSADALLDEEKNDLAITTLSKSGNYFDQSIQRIADAKRQGENISPTLDKILTASKKHQQIILQMEKKTKGDVRYNLELLFVRAKNFQDTVEVIKSD